MADALRPSKQQRPDMNIAADWDVKHQFKQTKQYLLTISCSKVLFQVELALHSKWNLEGDVHGCGGSWCADV